jgi:hypothetical protein
VNAGEIAKRVLEPNNPEPSGREIGALALAYLEAEKTLRGIAENEYGHNAEPRAAIIASAFLAQQEEGKP